MCICCKCCKKSIVLMTSGFFIFIFSLIGNSYNIISLDIMRIFVPIGLIFWTGGGLLTVCNAVENCVQQNRSEPENQPTQSVRSNLIDLFYW